MLKSIFGSSPEQNSSDDDGDQLWIMIKETGFFRDDSHIVLIDQISELVESSELGELDGHSSGSHQLEVNFYEVHNYGKTKSLIENYLIANYPEIEFTISNEYETTYEKP
jgi:hypothetical protein